MGTGGRVAAAVAAGYLLGRTKKLKLAITVGSMMAGKRIATDPRGLLRQASEYVDNSEQLAPLAEQVRGSLLDAGRSAAVSVMSNRLEAFSDSLHERSDQWRELPSRDEDAERLDEEPENAKASPTDEPAPPKKSSAGKKAASKTSTGKKADSKTSTGKKTASKTSTGKKTAAKKSTAAKSGTSGRSRSSKPRS